MNLLILTPDDLIAPGHYRVSGTRLAHIRNVLKLETGEILKAGLLNGPRGFGRIATISEHEAILVLERMSEIGKPALEIDVICAVPRPKILRKVLYVCAMFGVRSLYLVRANRSEKSYLLSPLMQADNQRPFLLEGLSQGEWTRIPGVELHLLFRPFCEDLLPDLEDYSRYLKLLADFSAVTQLEKTEEDASCPILLAIGPEGGWVDFEREMLTEKGFTSFSLGPGNLRVEYALAAALAQINLVRG